MRHWCMFMTALLLAAGAAAAQSGLPPIRPLGPELARSTVTFRSVSQLVALNDGRVLVSDAGLLVRMLDSSLSRTTVLLDSAAGQRNSAVSGAGGRGRGGGPSSFGMLLPFRGDSVLWFDGGAGVFLVVDSRGQVGRTMAPPAAGSGFSTTYGLFAAPTGSAIVFRSPWDQMGGAFDLVETREVGRPFWFEDSLAVLRMDFASRRIDTLARAVGSSGSMVTRLASGSTASRLLAPFPFADDVAVTSDGTVAIFHAREYRIDWIDHEGKRLPAAKLSYPWVRVSDEDRQRMLDSINGPRVWRYDSLMAQRAADSARTGAILTITRIRATADGDVPERVPQPPPRPPALALPEQIPDFLPPTGTKAFLADADNRIWLRPNPVRGSDAGGGEVWHVIDRVRGVVDRVRIPAGTTIAGFGPGGVVYLARHDAGVATLYKHRL